MLFIVDTCQAASLYQKFYSPNVLAIGSSLVGEDSLSHHVDPAIGVYIIDRYTYYALEFLEHVTPTSNQTLGQFVSHLLLPVISFYVNQLIDYLKLWFVSTVESLPEILVLVYSWLPQWLVPTWRGQSVHYRLFRLSEANRWRSRSHWTATPWRQGTHETVNYCFI